ncbi:MAG TPA: hypothetical protein VNY84_08125 [Acidimicrobiales bacterium]|nr:hypothetical protein [Acidimicrobiales bacterium]
MTLLVVLASVDQSRPERFILSAAVFLLAIWIFETDRPARRRTTIYDLPPEAEEEPAREGSPPPLR